MPPTPELSADAVLAAVAAPDPAALQALAAKDEPDPWLVADELIRRGEHDAAEAFAKAAPRVDTESLPTYVASRRGKPDDPARRARLAAASRTLARRAHQEALTALGDPEPALEDVVGVRLAVGRGIALGGLARLEEAARAFTEAAQAAEQLGWLARTSRAWDQAGGAAWRGAFYSVARRAWERGLEVCERRGDLRNAATTLGNLGNVHHVLGDYAKALAIHERALAAKEAQADRAGAAFTLGNIGVVHHALGDYAKALAIYERALAAQEALGDRKGAATTLGNIGGAHLDLSDYARALATFERALAAQEALRDGAGAARTLGNIGTVHRSLGDYAKALAIYERALAAKEALGDRAGAAQTLGDIGSVHYARGDYAKALAIHERALAARESLGDRAGAAATLGDIGVVHYALGDYAKALVIQERALEALEALGDRATAALMLGNIGNVHHALGDYAKALAVQERALAAQEALGSRRLAAMTLGNIAGVHGVLGDYAKALAIYERALAAREALGDPAGAALTLGNIGHAQQMLGDLRAARESLERAVRALRSLRAAPWLVHHLRNLAEVYLGQGHAGRALAAAREALRESESLLGGLGEEQGAQAREQFARLYEVGALAAVREEDLSEVGRFLEGGRAGALLDALGNRETLRWKAETLPAELRAAHEAATAAERRAHWTYERALRGSDRKARAQAARELDSARDESLEVTARIQRETKRAAGLFHARAKSLEDIQGALELGEALVLYGLCLKEALALVVEPEGERLVTLAPRAEIEAACEALSLRKPDGDPSEALAALRRLLIEPLGLGEGVKQALISPEGSLCFLPWGALLDRPVAVTPSGSTNALLRSEEREPGTGVLALGDPDYAGGSEGARAIYYRGKVLQPLPATRGEARSVSTVALLGAEASEDAFRAALPQQKRWRSVHFACHGLIDARRPGLSSLALSQAGEQDGFLTALEVMRMQIPADLAVLSACETATGKLVGGEGIVGITRAFMYAGTPRVLCSLWKVDDQATAALMTKFYECWLGSTPSEPGAAPGESRGLPAAEALRQAQAFLRAQGKWAHPYYWAAWVLWGLP